MLKLEADDFLRDLRKPCFCTELPADERLPQVAEAGSFGGGMLLYLAASSEVSRVFDELLRLVLLSFRRTELEGLTGSGSLGDSFSSDFTIDEKLKPRGPAGFCFVSWFPSPFVLGCM